jgi:PAS domain S-box-containing protein
MKTKRSTPEGLVKVRGTGLLVGDTRELYRQKLARIILDSMVQFVGLLDAKGSVLEISRVALDAAGITLSDVEGRPFWTTFWWQVSEETNTTLQASILRAAQGEFVRWDTEIYGRAGGKETIIIEASLMPVKDERGKVVFIAAEGRDITEKKAYEREIARQREELARLDELKAEAEEALRQSQKMEAVGQLTGGLAHDFNNLLTGIGSSLQMIKTRSAQGKTDVVDHCVTAAEGAVKRAAALTQRLLAFSRRQTIDPRPTNVNQLVAGMEELIRGIVGAGVHVDVVAAGDIWWTLVDPNQLENALLNLCINARDAMPDGGRLTIETANRWLDERVAAERDLAPGRYISLYVTDTGAGMTPEVVARAFDPFFTTKPLGEGTGLGLSMIYGFARQYGGQPFIYSEVGKGTTVCLYLPRHDGEAGINRDDRIEGHTTRAADGEIVMVIEDEPIIRMLIVEVIEEQGYSAIEAPDGPSAMRVLQTSERIDLLITDIGLPGGMSGQQIADTARLLHPELKVLFITGSAENSLVGTGRLDRSSQVVAKPFEAEVLARKIREVIENQLLSEAAVKSDESPASA